jgi:porphobilinogen synthase
MLIRPRRNRKSATIRSLVAETNLHLNDLVIPFFIIEGKEKKEPIIQMPGIFRFTLDLLLKELQSIHAKGILAIALFPSIAKEKKDKEGSEALNSKGLIPTAVALIKKEIPSLCIITDIALDPFTSHGHDGLVSEQGEIENDKTIEVLVNQAVLHATAGVDIVAPSDMMDGRIGAIRKGLDLAGFSNTSILSYTAKYASSLYAPFRGALKVKLEFGDKKSYQMNPANVKEALLEAALDEKEGADMLMVKPASLYLDVISKIQERTLIPVGAYHVSGEYAMVALAHEHGLLNKHEVFYETLLAIKRAGASFIFTYAYQEMLHYII